MGRVDCHRDRRSCCGRRSLIRYLRSWNTHRWHPSTAQWCRSLALLFSPLCTHRRGTTTCNSLNLKSMRRAIRGPGPICRWKSTGIHMWPRCGRVWVCAQHLSHFVKLGCLCCVLSVAGAPIEAQFISGHAKNQKKKVHGCGAVDRCNRDRPHINLNSCLNPSVFARPILVDLQQGHSPTDFLAPICFVLRSIQQQTGPLVTGRCRSSGGAD